MLPVFYWTANKHLITSTPRTFISVGHVDSRIPKSLNRHEEQNSKKDAILMFQYKANLLLVKLFLLYTATYRLVH